MKEYDKDWINKHYSSRLSSEGPTYEALRTGPRERRELRFKIIQEIGIKNGDSIIDIGCGYGDFAEYLIRNKIEVDYTGIDINPDFIEIARKKYPEHRFQLLDVINDNFEAADWIVSSSCFNLKLKAQSNYEFMFELLKVAYQHSKKGVAIDMFTDYVDFKVDKMFYYSPEKIFSMAKTITKRVCLRNDYPMFEFCIYLFPDFVGWAATSK